MCNKFLSTVNKQCTQGLLEGNEAYKISQTSLPYVSLKFKAIFPEVGVLKFYVDMVFKNKMSKLLSFWSSFQSPFQGTSLTLMPARLSHFSSIP